MGRNYWEKYAIIFKISIIIVGNVTNIGVIWSLRKQDDYMYIRCEK